MTTGIQWTDETWNPVAGCTHCSPGCNNCYAARLTGGRLKNRPQYKGLVAEGKFTGEIRLITERLDAPLRWPKPRRVFVNSMSDLFHQDVPYEFIASVFAVMQLAPQHQFQVLTKRPQRMAELLSNRSFIEEVDDERERLRPGCGDFTWPAPNVWLGTSIENDHYSWRANYLRAASAAVRFLSCEPLLGPLSSLDLTGIDWLIVGGESGPGARPMDEAWARQLHYRCDDEGVPFFFKQAGSVLARSWATTDRQGHKLEEIPIDLRVRDWPLAEVHA